MLILFATARYVIKPSLAHDRNPTLHISEIFYGRQLNVRDLSGLIYPELHHIFKSYAQIAHRDFIGIVILVRTCSLRLARLSRQCAERLNVLCGSGSIGWLLYSASLGSVSDFYNKEYALATLL